ncbi:MAG: sensor histidine kinase, partial [Gemmatimonadota bacterium]
NVVKHAGVRRASLHVSDRDGVWMIDVADEGCGFDPRAVQTGSESGGFGLQNARERLRLFGGEIEIDATPAEGTRVTVRMPFPPARTTRASREGRKRGENRPETEKRRDDRRLHRGRPPRDA